MWEFLREQHHRWIDWWFDRPWMYAVIVLGIVAAFLLRRAVTR